MLAVSGLFIYPIKSCRGIAVQAFRLDDLGPVLDRRFMLVDENGLFVSQRVEPRLALVAVSIHPVALRVDAPGMKTLELPLAQSDDGVVVEAEVWTHRGPVFDAGADAREWFSEFLGRPYRLVRFPAARLRRVDPKYATEEAYTAFTDGYPELLLSEASIADLGQRAHRVFPTDRFRPNILLTGARPYEEDTWKRIRIGEVPFDVVKPCKRCVIITIDQATGKSSPEALATLANFRKQGNGVMFGQNCVHRALGLVRVGDPITVVEAG